MKRALFLILLAIACINLSAQTEKAKHNPAGKWEFEAPTAPQGYTAGAVEVTLTDNKYNATLSFTGNDYKIPVDEIKFENDTLRISLNVDGTDVKIKMKFDEINKMSGIATTYDSEIPIALTREKK